MSALARLEVLDQTSQHSSQLIVPLARPWARRLGRRRIRFPSRAAKHLQEPLARRHRTRSLIVSRSQPSAVLDAIDRAERVT
jgi:hypothetical protein